jgi:uncharacterized protein YqeY
MSIKEKISNDIKDLMRSKEKDKLNVMRLVTSAIKQIEVDERIEVDEARMLIILDKLVKQRNESITQFKAAGRDDLVTQEQFELDVISQYLPEPLSESEIEALIEQALCECDTRKMSEMGKVMAKLKPLLQGRADMAKVSLLIKAKLQG